MTQKAKKNFSDLLAAAKKVSATGGGEYDDKEFYYPARDKAGNGFAVIRFLPGKDGNLPFIKKYSHGFKNEAGKWFIEECPTTLGNPCPVCDANSILWNSGLKSDKEIARARKRKLQYISNVLVITDSKNPENEGKVKLFKYGKSIFDKIMESLDPPAALEGDVQKEAVNIFDEDEGANFRFRIRVVDKQTNYDTSDFDDVSPINMDIDKLMENAEDLTQFTAPTMYKSFDELKEKFDRHSGGYTATTKNEQSESDNDFAKRVAEAAARKAEAKAEAKTEESESPGDDDDDDEAMKRFMALAND